MIHYQLRCSRDHEFDGWFRDSDAFIKQAAAGLVECPQCGDVTVNRALMAPSLGRKGNAKAAPVVDQQGRPEPAPSLSAPPMSAPPQNAAAVPDQVRAMLQKLRAEVESKCEHVGSRFADEARAIHKGEVAARGIYGEATPEQAEALADEGIEVARIPWVPRADG